jgi:hypothetical protein
VQWRHLKKCNPSCESFSTLPKEFQRCGAEKQKAAGLQPLGPALIDKSPKRFKEAGRALNLVENDPPVFMGGEKKPGISQLFAVPEVFQIKVETIEGLSELPGESGFPDLPGPKKGCGRLAG